MTWKFTPITVSVIGASTSPKPLISVSTSAARGGAFVAVNSETLGVLYENAADMEPVRRAIVTMPANSSPLPACDLQDICV